MQIKILKVIEEIMLFAKINVYFSKILQLLTEYYFIRVLSLGVISK